MVGVTAGLTGVVFQRIDGTQLCIGTLTSTSYSCAWNGIAAGSYSLRARATVNGQTFDSATFALNVAAPPSTVSLTRSYVYDANERLCKVINPESGATVYAYDGASNVLWTAEGSALTSNTCDRDSVPLANRIVRQYDAMNRVEYLDYPGTTADIAYSYEADGALKTISTGGNEWSYSYNNRRLQSQESLKEEGNTYNIGYSYLCPRQPQFCIADSFS